MKNINIDLIPIDFHCLQLGVSYKNAPPRLISLTIDIDEEGLKVLKASITEWKRGKREVLEFTSDDAAIEYVASEAEEELLTYDHFTENLWVGWKNRTLGRVYSAEREIFLGEVHRRSKYGPEEWLANRYGERFDSAKYQTNIYATWEEAALMLEEAIQNEQ